MPRTYTTAADAAADGWLPAKRVLRSSPELIAMAETIRQHGGEGVIGISDTSGPQHYGYSFAVTAAVFYRADPGPYPYYPEWREYDNPSYTEREQVDADARAWAAQDSIERVERRTVAESQQVWLSDERKAGGGRGAFMVAFHRDTLVQALRETRGWIIQTLARRAAELEQARAARSSNTAQA